MAVCFLTVVLFVLRATWERTIINLTLPFAPICKLECQRKGMALLVSTPGLSRLYILLVQGRSWTANKFLQTNRLALYKSPPGV
jgi:hypothetical protein